MCQKLVIHAYLWDSDVRAPANPCYKIEKKIFFKGAEPEDQTFHKNKAGDCLSIHVRVRLAFVSF